jgi:hypothetical protein
MTIEMDNLITAVRANEDVEDSAIAAFAALGPMIAGVAGDKAAAIALADEVTAKGAALAAAIVTVPTP